MEAVAKYMGIIIGVFLVVSSLHLLIAALRYDASLLPACGALVLGGGFFDIPWILGYAIEDIRGGEFTDDG